MSMLRYGSTEHQPEPVEAPAPVVGVVDDCPRCGSILQMIASSKPGSKELVCISCKWAGEVGTHK